MAFFMGKIHVENFFAQKNEKKLFSCRFPPLVFFIAVSAVSLHAELKNTITTFSKIGPENLKKSQKK
jgi:hypothetical protein